VLHMRCNLSLGGKLGRARQLARATSALRRSRRW
jgi:hypothetical protein